MGFLFWIIFFGAMSLLWKQIKNSWREKNFFRVTMWVIAILIVFMIFGFIRENIMQQKRGQWRKEYQSSAVQYELPCKNFDLKEVHLQ